MSDEKKAKASDSTTPDATAEEIKLEAAPTQVPQKRLDETIPGGKYLVNGQLVNAQGDPIKAEKE